MWIGYKKFFLSLALFIPSICCAQTQIGGGGGAGGLAFVASVPATCTPGVTASVQLNVSPFTINVCTATNTWTALVQPNVTNVYTAGLQDFTSATMEIPEAAGFTANVNSTIGLDTTANSVHFWTNNADSINLVTASANAGGKCLQSNGTTGLVVEVTGACAVALPAIASSTPVTSSNPTINTDQQLIELTLTSAYLNILNQPYLIHGAGIYSSTAASQPALTIKVKLCTVSGCGSGTVVTLFNVVSTALNTAALTNATWNFFGECVTSATGATGNLICHGSPGFTLDTGATLSTPDTLFADTNTAVSSNIALNGSLFLDFTIAQSVAGASNSYTQQMSEIAPTSGAGGSGITASAGQTLYGSGTNTIAGSGVVLDMNGISGADLGAKMNNCAAALPAGGGTCKGDNLTGALTLSTAVTTAVKVIYTFCGQAITQTAAITFANVNSGIIWCQNGGGSITKGANLDQITLSAANTIASGVPLVGVAGSFTGNGIVVSGTALVTLNNVSGEASQAIKNTNSSAIISYNTVVGAAAGQPVITSAGSVLFNTVTTNNSGDGIDVNGNFATVLGNNVTVSPSSALSNICGIKVTGDIIGVRVLINQLTINDSNNGDINYGACDTPTVGHNLNILFEADHVQGVLSNGATADGFFLNNTAGLNTNWNVTIRDIGCVHLTFCIKRTDAQNNITKYENIQPGDVALDAGTGSTNDVWTLLTMPAIGFASLPTPAGNGSAINCTSISYGIVGAAGSSSGLCERISGNWQLLGPGAPAVLSTAYTNATTTPSNIPGLAIPVSASQNYAITCNLFYQGSANTAGLDVTVTGPVSPTFVIMEYVENWAGVGNVNNSRANAFGSKMAGATTTDTNFNAAQVTIGLNNGTNAGTVQIQGSATGAGTVTVYQSSYCTQH